MTTNSLDTFLARVRKGVIHVGGNIGQDAPQYASHGLRVVWVEPIPQLFEQLVARIQAYPLQTAIKALLSDREEDVTNFFVSNLEGQASSVFPLGDYRDLWPECRYVGQLTLASMTLKRLMEERQITASDFDALVLHAQGSELSILKGCGEYLEQLDFLWIRTADFDAYHGGCKIDEIKEFLQAKGFGEQTRVEIATRRQGGAYYDVLFSRTRCRGILAETPRVLQSRKIHTFGDSHAVYGYSKIQFNGFPIACHHLGPKTMFSVCRDGTQVLDIARSEYGVQEGDVVIFCFGEIDCRCHIGKYGADWVERIEKLAFSYVGRILENTSKYDDLTVFVASVVPPVKAAEIKEDPEYPFVGRDQDRHAFVKQMNHYIDRACLSTDLVFLDSYSKYCTAEGFLQPKLSDGHVHVLDPRPIADLLLWHLDGRQKKHQLQTREFLQRLRPRVIDNLRKIRIGNRFDGGYVIPCSLLRCDSLLSIGVGPDVSFDLAFANLGARVMQYDHTVEGAPRHQQHDNFTFVKKGWGPSTTSEFSTLTEMVRQIEILAGRKKILKFDIEGAEYANLKAIDDEILGRFDGIVCELHWLDQLSNPEFVQLANIALDRLTKHHVPVHIHPNNCCGVALVHGIPIPRLLEVTLLKCNPESVRDYSTDPIPGPLDNPNNPNIFDVSLNPFSTNIQGT